MALQPLLGPGLPQMAFPFFSTPARLHPRIPKTCNASLWTMSSHLILGFPIDLVLWIFPLSEPVQF